MHRLAERWGPKSRDNFILIPGVVLPPVIAIRAVCAKERS